MKRIFSRGGNRGIKGIQSSFNKLATSNSLGGLFLILVTLFTIISANSESLSHILEIWKIEGGISFGNFSLEMSLQDWVNDALMALFFFVVGLEIKREMMVGGLSSFKKASLPIFAAIGGMIFPVIIYYLINMGEPTQHGWGIPMATDIAFSLGVISLLGKFIGKPLGIFILTFTTVKLKITELPTNIKWSHIFSVGVIAGIGFTMSIFINSLAFSNPAHINEGKAAILITSLISGLIGLALLRITLKGEEKRVKYRRAREF